MGVFPLEVDFSLFRFMGGGISEASNLAPEPVVGSPRDPGLLNMGSHLFGRLRRLPLHHNHHHSDRGPGRPDLWTVG